MLLTESSIAKEIRDQLLNIEEKTSVEIKVADNNEEQELALAIGMAMAYGDLVALGEANAKMMAFKNRYITILERVSSHPQRIEEQKPMVTFAEKISYKLASPK
ncbi:hypothetical protein BKC07_19135 [Peribacillus simplex]|nr:hypothetical protein BKC07_19135 [Peribacillus simplex]